MGLFIFMAVPLIHLNGPIIFMAGAADKLKWAHYCLWHVLLISLNGPIIFMADTAYNRGAHLCFIAGAANLGPIFLWQVLLINLNGPIIFMAGAANKLEGAHYVLWQVLAIKNNGPIQAYRQHLPKT